MNQLSLKIYKIRNDGIPHIYHRVIVGQIQYEIKKTHYEFYK